MEMGTFIGGIIIAAISGGSITGLFLTRRWKNQDRRTEIHESNHGKMIDADQEALRMFKERLETVEDRLEDLTESHTVLRLENERLKAEAKHTESENKRQDEEIQNLRRRNHDLSSELQKRDATIAALTTKIEELEKRVGELIAAKADHAK